MMTKESFKMNVNLDFFLNYTILGYRIAPVVIALSIAIVTLLSKNLLANLLMKPLRMISKRTDNDLLDRIADSIEGPLRLLIVIAGLYIAASWIHTSQQVQLYINLVFKSFFIIAIFWVLFELIDVFSVLFNFFSSKTKKGAARDIRNFLTKTLRVLVIVLGVMAVLQEWGINVSAFVASLGLGGLAFALAAKDTVANFFGSLVVFTDRPFQVGDLVELEGVEGNIEEIGVRSTKIRTNAQALVSIPNAVMATAKITNWSRMGKRRIKTRIGLTYTTTIEQLRAITDELQRMLQNHPDVHQEAIGVNFDEFQDSALSISLNFFTITIDAQKHAIIRQEINFKIMEIVAKHNASFAFPSQSIYVESLPK